MNTITFHKIPALAFVSILSLTTGCTAYGGGPYTGGYGGGSYGAGTGATTSANIGFADDLIRNVGPLLGPTSQRLTGSASQSIRRLEQEARRQEREAKARLRKEQQLVDRATRQQQIEDMKKQRVEQREQTRIASRAEWAARKEAERQRVALLTPEERKKEAEIAQRKAVAKAKNQVDLSPYFRKGLELGIMDHFGRECPAGYWIDGNNMCHRN